MMKIMRFLAVGGKWKLPKLSLHSKTFTHRRERPQHGKPQSKQNL
jgi:hypothetical protein